MMMAAIPGRWVGRGKGVAAEDAERGVAGGSGSGNGGGGGGSSAGVAPSYINSQFVDGGLPKGKNLTEGGFSDSEGKNNTSFNGEIGGRDDPGRLAEERFEKSNAEGAGGVGMPRQMGGVGDNAFDVIGGDAAA